MPVDCIPLDKAKNGFSAVYRSDATRELDRMYNLDGTPLADGQIARLSCFGLGLPSAESEALMPYFTFIAGKIGWFAGVPLNELPERQKRYVGEAKREGWLQTYEHEGTTVIEPAGKLGIRFSRYGRIER